LTSKIRVLLLRLQRHQIQVLTQVQMQDLMQEQIPVPIKEWSRASVKAQIQINTTKKNVRMHILFLLHKPDKRHQCLHEMQFAGE
jgi:hypothetical protein